MLSKYTKTVGFARISKMPKPTVFVYSAYQAAKYSTPAANSGWSFSPGTFTNVPLL